MNWKLLVGLFLQQTEQRILKLNSNFVKNNYPYGRDWMFDVKRILPNASLIIDVGANVGSLSLELNYWFPNVPIYAFEPVSSTYGMLAKNSTRKIKIQPVNMGLGAANERKTILLSSENTINSLKITESNQNIVGSQQIDIVRLDWFLRERNLNNVDILKIDVEGYELEVLEGCGSLLNEGIKCIYLEVGYHREPTKVYFADLDSYMEKNGFELCGIYETRRNLSDKRRLWYSNNLYVKKGLLN